MVVGRREMTQVDYVSWKPSDITFFGAFSAHMARFKRLGQVRTSQVDLRCTDIIWAKHALQSKIVLHQR